VRTQSLVERVEADECLQLADGLELAPEGEHGVEPALQSVQPKRFESGDLGVRVRLGREVAERGASPQREGAGETQLRLLVRARAERGLSVGEELLELVYVHRVGRDVEAVAGRLGEERGLVAEELSELRDVDLDAVGCRGGRPVAPERVHEPISRNDAVSLEEEQSEDAALLETPEREHARLVDHLEGPENPELDHRSPLWTTREP
jgi:hypothetical protein